MCSSSSTNSASPFTQLTVPGGGSSTTDLQTSTAFNTPLHLQTVLEF